jgi:hypothetical protein
MSSLPVPELGDKRPRDDFTEALIRDALEEEEARKRAKKGGAPGQQVQRKKPKGQTLREIEEEEGGPVKESLVSMAAVQRALRRKRTNAGTRGRTLRILFFFPRLVHIKLTDDSGVPINLFLP